MRQSLPFSKSSSRQMSSYRRTWQLLITLISCSASGRENGRAYHFCWQLDVFTTRSHDTSPVRYCHCCKIGAGGTSGYYIARYKTRLFTVNSYDRNLSRIFSPLNKLPSILSNDQTHSIVSMTDRTIFGERERAVISERCDIQIGRKWCAVWEPG